MIVKPVLITILLLIVAAKPSLSLVLGIKGEHFTLDGKPAFLLGISYYGGLGARKEFICADLDDIRRSGFNWIRVWATWKSFDEDVSAVDSEGNPRQPFLGRLEELVRGCSRRGIVVDVTLSRGNGTGPSKVRNQALHLRAIGTICGALKRFRNWYLDLGNERNIRDSRFVPFDDLGKLRDAAKKVCPWLLVTASQGEDISRKELHEYLKVVDFIAPHRPRDRQSPQETEAATKQLLFWMREEGKTVPIHYQEPFRREYSDWNPTDQDYLDDLRGARDGGAAGWCLHNGAERTGKDSEPRRSFDLRRKRLFDQLDSAEKEAISRIRAIYSGRRDDPARTQSRRDDRL